MFVVITILQIPGRASGHDPYLGGSSAHATVVPTSKQRTKGVDDKRCKDTVGAVPMWGWAPRQRASATLRTQGGGRGTRAGGQFGRCMHAGPQTGPRAVRVRVRALQDQLVGPGPDAKNPSKSRLHRDWHELAHPQCDCCRGGNKLAAA